MFGYVRPLKADLLVKEFYFYRAIYCGLCKSIGRRHGQVARLAINYDFTFVALLLLCLTETEIELEKETCIVNPIQKRAMAQAHPILDFCADMIMLFAFHKAQDDIADGAHFKGKSEKLVFARAYNKVKAQYPEIAKQLADGLKRLDQLETQTADLVFMPQAENYNRKDPSHLSGSLLGEVLQGTLQLPLFAQAPAYLAEALWNLGFYLGRWVYLLDALDDYKKDEQKGEFNLLLWLASQKQIDLREAKRQIVRELSFCESQLQKFCRLLPLRNYGDIIANILFGGLPQVRQQILGEKKLERL